MKEGTALLVDGDNVPPDILGAILDRLEREGPVTERRIFRNWRSSRNAAAWDDASKAYAFERVDRYRTSAGKNASDIALVVTAMDLLHGGFRSFCIASGDTDFAPLIERLRRAGAKVVLVGHKGDGGILTDVADEYVDFRNLDRPAAPRRGPGARAPPSRAPARQAAGRRQAPPRPAPAKRARKAAAPPRPPARQSRPARPSAAPADAGLDDLRLVLLDSYEVARTDGEVDEQGWVAVDRLGQIARSVDPAFSLGKYGVGNRASLSKVFARLGTSFEVQAVGRSGNRQYQVRRRG
ncbi:MAG: NYN domain-containing protein [Thermoplasmatota archaeon]